MVRGFQALVNGAANLEPASLLTLRLALTETKYRENSQILGFYDDVLRRINALPGVKSAVAVTALPYSGHSSGRSFTIEGRPVERGDQPSSQVQNVSPKYFETLHVPLRSGRLLGQSDGTDTLRVAVISERMAHRWFPHESPIGKRFKFGAPDSKEPWITITGVVGNTTHDVFDRNPRSVIYVPMEQFPRLWMDIGVRTAGDPLQFASAVTAAIRAVDPEQPISGMATLETWMHEQSVGLNYMAVLMGIFGILALTLSSVGVYGVMAYVVTEQTPEIGIRMALGAARSSVLGDDLPSRDDHNPCGFGRGISDGLWLRALAGLAGLWRQRNRSRDFHWNPTGADLGRGACHLHPRPTRDEDRSHHRSAL